MSADTDFLDLSGVRMPKDQAALLNAKTFPLLEGLSAVSMRILQQSAKVMHVSKGVEMLHEGDTPHDLYFIETGKLAIGKQVGTQLRVIAQLGPGNIYGEFGVLRKKARYASVYTVEPSRVIRVEISAIQQVLDADASFRERLTKLLTQRMLDSFFFSHPVFTGMPLETRNALSRALDIRFCPRGSRIFSQGDAPSCVFLILSGEVEVRYLNKAGAEVLLEIRRDNDLLGEVATKNGTELAYSAIAASDVDLLELNKKTMQILRDHHPAATNQLESYIDKRTTQTVKRLKENLI
ncbi:MAG TPA: cyclic nucleotide-binding domain-containing protein [Mariprofundaceae bacterium]|nr:cyclic nucleotide-binding domain-containing protein [Mariprofundaceae bacterium]